MIRGIRKTLSALSVCIVLSVLSLVQAAADEAQEPEIAHFDLPCTVTSVKVGLYSGSEALYEAGLQNYSGGYELGYYDFSRQFRKICTLDCGNISVKADDTWHVLYAKGYDSAAEATAAAKTLGGIATYVDGQFKVAVGCFESEADAEAIASSDGEAFKADVAINETDADNVLFLFKSGRIDAALLPEGDNAKLGDYIYSGGFEFLLNDSRLTVINYVDLEDYVKGVLPYEVGGNWPSDSLKAQAVCARTYAINNINAYIDDGFDVRADTYSQVYRGLSGTTVNTDIAADDTSGCFVRYEGAICRVYYMSSSGGATESGANVFGERREYLSGVTDPYEGDEDFYNKSWKETKSEQTLLSRLRRYGYELSDIVEVTPEYSDTGNVISLVFRDSKGNTATVRQTNCYMVPGLNSMRYSVTENNGAFEFFGEGWGHNCGMSQWGAYSMAKNYGFTCDEIIAFYFSGAYIR